MRPAHSTGSAASRDAVRTNAPPGATSADDACPDAADTVQVAEANQAAADARAETVAVVVRQESVADRQGHCTAAGGRLERRGEPADRARRALPSQASQGARSERSARQRVDRAAAQRVAAPHAARDWSVTAASWLAAAPRCADAVSAARCGPVSTLWAPARAVPRQRPVQSAELDASPLQRQARHANPHMRPRRALLAR